jgi:SM-20-related protein
VAADLFVVPAFLDEDRREELFERVRASGGAPAPVYGTDPTGGAVHAGVRRTIRVAVPDTVRDEVLRRLEDARPQLERHFGVVLSHCEEPQFLRYGPGDFFVAHQDGNTGLIRDDARHRRVSAVLFLNRQSAGPEPEAYGGGDLVFHGQYPDWMARHPVPATPGTLVAFRSETTHEVTPVTHGHRYTVVTWYR